MSSSKLIIGIKCLQSREDCIIHHSKPCIHVVHENDKLNLWSIKMIRDHIFEYDQVLFVNYEEMNFSRGDDVFEKSNRHPKLRHYIGNGIKSCLSDL